MLAGQVSTTGLALTVKVRMQLTGDWQSLVAVKVTVAVPPQALGATVLLLVKTVLQPPLTEAVASQAANFVSIAACDWQATSVTLVGQFKLTTGAIFTVKVRVQVTAAAQLDVTVKVTVAVPPQALGAPVLLFVKTALQPPLNEAVASQSAYFMLI